MTKVLFLGPQRSPLLTWLNQQNEDVFQTTDKLSLAWLKQQEFELLVSYGYRHILTADVLALFPKRAINLHISYLPWNRGADPNFWSFYDNTPKGVTIHLLDEGIDTGDILVQEMVTFDSKQATLASSYQMLTETIEALFYRHWHQIKKHQLIGQQQSGQGSYHSSKALIALNALLPNGWQTPVVDIVEAGVKARKDD